MRGNKTFGFVIILALAAMFWIFVAEEIRLEVSNSKFEMYEMAEDAININTASREELKTLGGVGDAMAEKIIKFRTETRAFETVEDLMLVKGFGEKMLEKNRNRITVK